MPTSSRSTSNPPGPDQQASPQAWRLSPRRELRLRRWGGEAVVYACDSGDTLLVDALAVDVLECLAAEPARPHSIEALLERLGASDEGSAAGVVARLEQLRRYELVEQVGAC